MKITNKQALLLLTLTSARFIGSAAECTGATDVMGDVCSFTPDRTLCGYNPGCNWNGRACVGADCSDYKNENSCNNQLGCFWMVDGNDGDYFPPPEDVEDEMHFDHEDMSDWIDQGLDDIWPDDIEDIGNVGYGPSGPSLWSSTEEKGTKDYRVNLAVKTILFTLLAIVCLVGVVMISKRNTSKGGDSDANDNVKRDGSQDEKNVHQKNADDDDQDVTIEHDEEEGRSLNEINGAPTYEIDSDDE